MKDRPITEGQTHKAHLWATCLFQALFKRGLLPRAAERRGCRLKPKPKANAESQAPGHLPWEGPLPAAPPPPLAPPPGTSSCPGREEKMGLPRDWLEQAPSGSPLPQPPPTASAPRGLLRRKPKNNSLKAPLLTLEKMQS